MKIRIALLPVLFTIISMSESISQTTSVPFEQYIKENIATRAEIDVFLKDLSWADFDPVTGYRLGNYIPHDGVDNSSTISTSRPNGTRTSFVYAGKPCRINTYGNSFTLCHQVSDGETWQEYLAAHIGEPIRNFGMGGYGVYQAYRRMLREEKTADSAKYIILYIWGNDHVRSLLRCRYMTHREWTLRHDESEGTGKMFHGNFWANLEMDLNTGRFIENDSRVTSEKDLYKMTDAGWMVENLKTDLALQMMLFSQRKISDIDINELKKLSARLNFPVDLDNIKTLPGNVSLLLNKYGFAATRYILDRSGEFAAKNGKKLLIVLFDPYNVTRPMLNNEERYDQEIVDYLDKKGFYYFDMNLAHAEDYKDFKPGIPEYFSRYFVNNGHYSPAGNHFFAYSIKSKIVDWLDPKPVTYQRDNQKLIDFRGYLENNEF